MFKIDYSFLTKNGGIDTNFLEKLNIKNLSGAKDISFSYDMFFGDVFFKSDLDRTELILTSMPILDLSYSLLDIYISFFEPKGKKQVFEFTDSDFILFFEKSKGQVYLSTSYSEEKLDTDIDSFKTEIRKFFIDVTDRIKLEFPEIMENEHFVDLLKILDEFDNLNLQVQT